MSISFAVQAAKKYCHICGWLMTFTVNISIREMDHFQGSNFVRLCLPPLWKGRISKRKDFASLGSKFFPLPFFRWHLVCWKNRKSQKLSSLFKMAEKNGILSC